MVDRAASSYADDFAERLGAPTPTPGGGAAAARAGHHGAALLQMVAGITLAKVGDQLDPGDREELEEILAAVRGLGGRFREHEAEDVEAFEAYISALRLPKTTDEEKAARRGALRGAARRATEAPLHTIETALETLRAAHRLAAMAGRVRLRAESDIGVAAELVAAAVRGAELNVRVNLPALGEERAAFEERLRELLRRNDELYPPLRELVLGWLG